MPCLREHHAVSRLYLFGSYARGEARGESDIDLLVDFDRTPDLLNFIEMEKYLKKQLRKKVDLVPRRKLKSPLRARILEEAIAI